MADASQGNGSTPLTYEQRLTALESERSAVAEKFDDLRARIIDTKRFEGKFLTDLSANTLAVQSMRRELQDQSGRIGNLSLVVHELKTGLQAFRDEVAPALKQLVGAVGVLVDRAAVKKGRRTSSAKVTS